MTEPRESADATAHEPPSHGEAEAFDPAEYRPSSRALSVTGLAALLVVAVLVAAGAVPRLKHRAAAEREGTAAASALPQVQVVRAHRATGAEPVALPGTVQPLQETAVYARANGYVRRWYYDIGTEVKNGQVLATLDLPDIDQELRQAEATEKQAEAGIAQSKSQRELARVTNDRFQALVPAGVVSRQLTDQYSAEYGVQVANVDAAEAATRSAEANVRRIEALLAFGTIPAPFDGVITMRSAEIGQLVVAGTGQGQPLFKVAEVDVVRVFVSVPQLYAGGIHPGMDAPTTIREAPGRKFPGKVGRTSHELDLATRSLLVEVDIPNADRTLVSGMYANVSFDVRRQDAPLIVPGTSVLIDARGTRVAVVRDGLVHWQKVDIEADLGDRLALAKGGPLVDGEAVALIPSERLTEGMQVRAQSSQ